MTLIFPFFIKIFFGGWMYWSENKNFSSFYVKIVITRVSYAENRLHAFPDREKACFIVIRDLVSHGALGSAYFMQILENVT